MNDEMKPCPQCESPYGYFLNEQMYACPEYAHKWNPAKVALEVGMKEKKYKVTFIPSMLAIQFFLNE